MRPLCLMCRWIFYIHVGGHNIQPFRVWLYSPLCHNKTRKAEEQHTCLSELVNLCLICQSFRLSQVAGLCLWASLPPPPPLCLSSLSPLSHVFVPLPYLYLLYHLYRIRLSVSLGLAVFSGYSCIRARSMLRTGHATCNLCGSRIYSFAATKISEIIYRDSPQDLNIFSPHNSWICGRPADLEDVHFDEMWTWSCTFRAGKCCFKHPD